MQIDNAFVILCSSYLLIFATFIAVLRLSQRCNLPRLFQLTAIVSAISAIFIPTFLKVHFSVWTDDVQLNFGISGLTILLAMKFFELGFCHQWIYVRQMTLKLAVMYIIGFPRMFEEGGKLRVPDGQTVRHENVRSIVRGVGQFVALRTLLYAVPVQWLTASSSSQSLVMRYARYGLFSMALYMWIDAITSVGFGFYGLVFDLPMKPVFPAFPFTSTSLREFWSRRWNRLIQSSLQLVAFVAIPSLLDPFVSLNNTFRGLLAFTVSGIIHEYMAWFATGVWSGHYMLFFWIHGLLVTAEIAFNGPLRSDGASKGLLGWLWTIGILSITVPLFFDPIVEGRIFAGSN